MPSFDEFKSKKAFQPWDDSILQLVDNEPTLPQNTPELKKTLRSWDKDILEQLKIIKPTSEQSRDTSKDKLATNWQQTGNKLVTIPTQLRHNSDTTPTRNPTQPRHNSDT